MDQHIKTSILVVTSQQKPLLQKYSKQVITGPQFSKIILGSHGLVINAKSLLARNNSLPCPCYLFSLILHFQNGA
jgi:hypothetical protein